jgi:hypothetical protein
MRCPTIYSRPIGGTGGEWNLFGLINRIFIVHDKVFLREKETSRPGSWWSFTGLTPFPDIIICFA